MISEQTADAEAQATQQAATEEAAKVLQELDKIPKIIERVREKLHAISTDTEGKELSLAALRDRTVASIKQVKHTRTWQTVQATECVGGSGRMSSAHLSSVRLKLNLPSPRSRGRNE